MALPIEHRAGNTFAYVGSLALPPSAWTGSVSLVNTADRATPPSDWGISVAVVLIGANALDPTKTDYLFAFTAPAATTSRWPVRGPLAVLDLTGTLIMRDAIGQVTSTLPFTVRVRGM